MNRIQLNGSLRSTYGQIALDSTGGQGREHAQTNFPEGELRLLLQERSHGEANDPIGWAIDVAPGRARASDSRVQYLRQEPQSPRL